MFRHNGDNHSGGNGNGIGFKPVSNQRVRRLTATASLSSQPYQRRYRHQVWLPKGEVRLEDSSLAGERLADLELERPIRIQMTIWTWIWITRVAPVVVALVHANTDRKK
jgi:hypothetical protein